MDYAEIMVELRAASKRYQQAILKNRPHVALLNAEMIHELSVELVQTTDRLWREYEIKNTTDV
jgi:hypothetical protein